MVKQSNPRDKQIRKWASFCQVFKDPTDALGRRVMLLDLSPQSRFSRINASLAYVVVRILMIQVQEPLWCMIFCTKNIFVLEVCSRGDTMLPVFMESIFLPVKI